MRRPCRTLALPEFEPLENVHAGRGIASNHDAAGDLPEDARGLLPDVAPPLRVPAAGLRRVPDLLLASARRRSRRSRDQTIARMVAGIEAEIFRPDDELRRLARDAVELGVDAPFEDGVSVDEILEALSASGDARSPWLEELKTSRDPWFNVNVGRWVLPLPPRPGTTTCPCRSRRCRSYTQVRAGESLDRRCTAAGRARAADRGLSRAARHRRRSARPTTR